MTLRCTLLLAATLCAAFAQPPAAPRRGPAMPEPLGLNDYTGFESIFDGTMKGWDGNPDFWRVENGVLVGETTKEKALKVNTFLVWRAGEPGDFELKVDYRINNTNSGIQYRSVELLDVGKWVMKGYQADIDFQNTYSGQLYEERGRGFLALRGQMNQSQEGHSPKILGAIHSGDELKGYFKINDWNTMHIVAKGNMLMHIVNGHLMSVFIDDDGKNRAAKGLLGFQIHMGPPMKAEFRNVYLKKL